MDLECRVRLVTIMVGNSFKQPVPATVHLGVKPRDPLEPVFVLDTRSVIYEFKVANNVKRVYKEEVFQGRVGIEFYCPPYHVLVTNSEADELADFLGLFYNLMDREVMEKLEYIPILRQSSNSKTKAGTVVGNPIIDCLSWARSQTLNTTAFNLKHHIPQYLKVLDLPHRLFKDIPIELGDLSLERINLENNALANENLAWLERLSIRKSLKYLNLAENKIDTFPSVLIDYESVITVIFRDNTIETIPHGINQMRSLKYLDMSGNNLRYLPGSLVNYKLTEADFTYNLLTSNVRLSFRPRLRNAGKNCLKLVDLALISVQIHQRKELTSEQYPRTLLEKLRQISFCICGRQTIPNPDSQFYTKLHRTNFALKCGIHPQKLDFSDQPLQGIRHKGNGVRNVFLQNYLCGNCEDEYVGVRRDNEFNCFRLLPFDDHSLPSST